MNIILKHTVKNIVKKPVRTFSVVFALFICSLSALLCLDATKGIRSLIETTFTASAGTADISFENNGTYNGQLPEGFPEADVLDIYGTSFMIYKDVPGEYNYATSQTVAVYSADPERASSMGLLGQFDTGLREAVISNKLSDEFGYGIGDTIVLYDVYNEPEEYTVSQIVPADIKNGIMSLGYTCLISEESYRTILCKDQKCTPEIVYIDVRDDSEVTAAYDMIKEKFHPDTITNLNDDPEVAKTMSLITAAFLILFAVTFLLVFFVTLSLCEKIINERMSFIGTLRSLGLSSGKTTCILLLENVLYALLGSIPACILYCLTRDAVMGSLFTVKTGDGSTLHIDMDPIPALLPVAVVIGAVVIECLLPLKEVLKAIKTSIRDIIFDNKDTEYKPSKPGMVIGILFLAAAVISFILRNVNIFLSIVFIICLISALALLFPLILKGATKLLHDIFEKSGNIRAALAAREVYARKSTVGSSILCATATAMCIIILSFATNTLATLRVADSDFDVNVTGITGGRETVYSYIEHLPGVSLVEYDYSALSTVRIGSGSEESAYTFYGRPEEGYLFKSELDLTSGSIEEGTIAITKNFAKRYGLKAGDTFEMTLESDSLFPIRRTFTVGEVFDGTSMDIGGKFFIMNENELRDLFRNSLTGIRVACNDPEGTSELINRYSGTTGVTAQTREEFEKKNQEEIGSFTRMITVIILLSAGMTSVGIISNQLAGFEGRKRECAVMVSTSMSRSALGRILFLESLIASAVSVLTGAIAGTILTASVAPSFADAGIYLFGNVDIKVVLVVSIGLSFLFSLTALSPVRHLKKMKISDQLKYE
ncbi:MAG: FtsX-like permease family protein [Clostridiales bacterium]|nr:FtsX-like permease family protein [Clostridiales bacterium]